MGVSVVEPKDKSKDARNAREAQKTSQEYEIEIKKKMQLINKILDKKFGKNITLADQLEQLAITFKYASAQDKLSVQSFKEVYRSLAETLKYLIAKRIKYQDKQEKRDRLTAAINAVVGIFSAQKQTADCLPLITGEEELMICPDVPMSFDVKAKDTLFTKIKNSISSDIINARGWNSRFKNFKMYDHAGEIPLADPSMVVSGFTLFSKFGELEKANELGLPGQNTKARFMEDYLIPLMAINIAKNHPNVESLRQKFGYLEKLLPSDQLGNLFEVNAKRTQFLGANIDGLDPIHYRMALMLLYNGTQNSLNTINIDVTGKLGVFVRGTNTTSMVDVQTLEANSYLGSDLATRAGQVGIPVNLTAQVQTKLKEDCLQENEVVDAVADDGDDILKEPRAPIDIQADAAKCVSNKIQIRSLKALNSGKDLSFLKKDCPQ